MKTPNKITEYYGDGTYAGLRSVVEECDGVYSVTFYKDNKFERGVIIADKSLRYAEDTAENYTLGILKFEDKDV
jgi:hypothetical protein